MTLSILAENLSFWEEFVLTFKEIGIVPAICLIVGIVFVIVEIFQPGFGFFGITGGILIIAGIAVRMFMHGAGNPLLQMVILIGIITIVLLLAFAVMVWSMRRGLLSRTSLVSKGAAVGHDRTLGTMDYGFLVGKEGVAQCALRPSGNVLIEGKIYDVVSQSEFVEKGTQVVVTQTEGGRIVVEIAQLQDAAV